MDLSKLQIPKEVLMAYLYSVGVLEIAKKQITDQENEIKEKTENAVNALRYPTAPSKPELYPREPLGAAMVVVSIMGGIFGGTIIGALRWRISHREGVFPSFGELLWVSLLPIAIIAAIAFLLALGSNHKVNKKINKKNQAIENKYNALMVEFRGEMEVVKSQESAIRAQLSAELSRLAPSKGRIEEELQKEYALDILPQKYRQLEAVLVMYNLLDTGRCDTLREALLAYDDFVWKKEDAQWKKAVTEQLSTIRQNQQKIFSSLEMLEEQTNSVSQMMKSGFQKAQANFAQIESQQQIVEGNIRTVRLLQDIHFWDTVT